MAAYLDELDAKSTDYAVRVQIACAQAIIEAVREASIEEQQTLHLLVTGEAGGTIRFSGTPAPSFTHWSGTATKPDNAVSEIQYDPACVDCRHDAGEDAPDTTWQCAGHVRAERDFLRAKLALKWTIEEQYEAACGDRDALSRMVEELRETSARLQERLDQFEAYAITVKSALDDRDRAARHEEALRKIADLKCSDPDNPVPWCGVCRARAALAGGGAAEREKEENRG
jgi:hypothetical protein